MQKFSISLLIITTLACSIIYGSKSNTPCQNLTQNITVSPQTSQTSVSVNMGDIIPWEMLKNLPYKQWGSKTGNFLYNKRYFLIATTALGSYLYGCHEWNKANKFLSRKDIWCAWHEEMALDSLVAVPQRDLAAELILEIQRRYSNTNNPTDFLEPLITFVKEIESEISIISKLKRAYYVFSRTHLSALFPINEKLFVSLDAKLQRSIYLKNLFLSWAAEYKISHNRKQRFVPPFKSHTSTMQQTNASSIVPPYSK